MSRFDVYRIGARAAPLVLDVQSDVLDDLASRVVIPLVPATRGEGEEMSRLKPRLVIQGEAYILMTTDIAALPRARLGAHVANIERDYRDVITNALDFLFLGF